MSKVKINSGLAAIMVIGGFIAGWQTMLIVCALLLLFAEIDEMYISNKNVNFEIDIDPLKI